MWGETLECEQDVWDVFHAYVSGSCNKTGQKVTKVGFLHTTVIYCEFYKTIDDYITEVFIHCSL